MKLKNLIQHIFSKKYDIIYSIGRDCACGGYLQSNNLRLTSGPFDWLTNASFEERFELILNNFDNFMNLEDFKFLPKNPNVFNDKKCDYYENTRTGFYYYHDFPTGVPIENVFDEVTEKYNRRIKRFYEKISNNKSILLVWFSHYHSTTDETVKTCCDKICEKFNKKIDFLIIEHKANAKGIIKRQIANNITRYTLHTIELDENNNPTVYGNQKLCNKIFQQYQIRLTTSQQIESFIRYTISKLVCLFIFDKSKRKRIKRQIRNNK